MACCGFPINEEKWNRRWRKGWEIRRWEEKLYFLEHKIPWGGSNAPNYYVGNGYYANELLLRAQFGYVGCGTIK